MSVTKSKLMLWDYKCAYQLCYLCVHDKSANAGTTLFGGFDVDHSKTPHLNQGAAYGSRDWLSLFLLVMPGCTNSKMMEMCARWKGLVWLPPA